MKIEVLQEQLINGLNIVTRAVASRAQLPVLSHVLMEATAEGLILSATDLEIGMRVVVGAKVVEPGKVTVPSKMFLEFLNSLNPGKVEIELDKESVIVKSPGYKAKFQTLPVEEFPAMPMVSSESEVCKINSEQLKNAVDHVVFASAKDSLRPVLTGVLCEFREKGVKLVATDGFRLAIEEVKIETKLEKVNLLVPARVVLEVIRLSDKDEVKIGYLEKTNQIYFVVGGVQIVSQLLSGSFPDYTKIMPKEFEIEIEVSKDELAQAIKAGYIFARDNSNMIRWSIGEAKIKVSSNSPERGECLVEVPAKITGDDLEIVFNARYLADYLSIAQGATLKVGLGSRLAPGMFMDTSRSEGKYIVMPINA